MSLGLEPHGLTIFMMLDIFHGFSYPNPLSGNIWWLLHSSSHSVPFELHRVSLIPPKMAHHLTPSAILAGPLPGSPLPGKAESGPASQTRRPVLGPRSC